MSAPQAVPNSGNVDIDALLTGYKWDTTTVTYSFPDSGWWYVLEQVIDELDFLDVIGVLGDWVSDPTASLINLLQEAVLGPLGDTGIVGAVALNGFQEFNQAQQNAAKFALDNVSAVSGLKFQEVDEGDPTFSLNPFDDDFGFSFKHGTIRFAETDSTSAPAFGIPPLDRVRILLGEGFLGDTWFDNDGRFDAPTPGDYAFLTIMHELGHAIGLKHGHESGLFGTNIPEWLAEALTDVDGPSLPDNKNSLEFSIMTYRSAIGGPDSLQAEMFGYPQSLMMLDIQALQYMYGANYDTNATDTVYSWDPNTGTMSINGVAQLRPGGTDNTPASNRVLLTIWDGNGNDTYDLSAYTTGVSINLLPGEWTKTSDAQIADLGASDARGNIANALLFNGDQRSLIENANGGSGNDTIIGNVLDNVLRGNDGNDSLVGSEGKDTLEGGAGNDTLDGGVDDDSLVGGAGNDSILGGDGADTIDAGSDNDTVLGGAGRDTIHGGDGNDSLSGEGDDDIVFGQAGNDTISGGDGNDTLTGDAGNDSISGDAGNDSITGGDGFDTLRGGAGNDTIDGGANDDLLDGGDNDDTLLAGTGNDTVIGGSGNDSVTGGDGNDSISGDAGFDTLDGGAGNDTIRGGSENDTIYGGAGNDSLSGDAGADYIDAGQDNDTAFGGEGNDTILGGDGNDSVDGGAGEDSIDAGTGDDTVLGGTGNDTILAGAGFDFVEGGDGADSIDGGTEADTIAGGAGNDTIYGGDGNDVIDGDGDNDLIHGGSGVDTVRGGSGNDDIFGEAGDDALYGNDGNDTLTGGAGRDTVDGGAGIDMASYSDATGPVVINLQDPSKTTGDAAGDLLISIEQFGLSNFDDTFVGLDDPLNPDVVFGRGGNDTLSGFAGNDELYGEDGDDFLYGGAGADILNGGAGFDTTSFFESKTGVIVDLVNPSRNTGIAAGDQIISVERFYLTGQKDEFVGLSADETVYGHNGNDVLYGNGGKDTLYGGDQNDFLSGGADDDLLFGEVGNDTLVGGDGNDYLDGGADKDELFGGAGNDTIIAGDGNDRIFGEAGDDLMYGGEGKDTFFFDPLGGWGKDIIVDFEDRADRIDFSLPLGAPAKIGMSNLTIFERVGLSGVETVIQLHGTTDEIVLTGIRAQQITSQDFNF